MASIHIDNVPDELMPLIQNLATQNNQTLEEQVIELLKQALQKPPKLLKFLISPETDSTWEERRKAVPKILEEIRTRRRVNPTDFGLPDSTDLIRQDRER
jgi:antitoxin FitA